ncbi:uncharacterized protein LOC129761245 [Toxorhynchites rutilus septentrionalis]|uniref:uncharacterized protein LOC129761245 n=1 Tax=Toxorhynchites rutilus septentrionalis TaxID=329112 RepID=UPI00247952B4|nr:uncharacterized protein LOC129761245 [Toxorhynchites rutilus septentrionalis]
MAGKYPVSSRSPYRDTSPSCSSQCPQQPELTPTYRTLGCSQILGRNSATSTMGAPNPPITVESFQPVTSSRPGPVYGIGEGVFHRASPGKYHRISNYSLPEISHNPSYDTLPPENNHDRAVRPHVIEGHQQRNVPRHVTRDSNRLLIYYQNVRGLRTKIDDFFAAVSESYYDIIILTETWLDDRIFSPQLFGNTFTVYRNDRNSRNSSKSRGGGVLIAVSSMLGGFIDPTPVCDTLEQLWVKIRIEGLVVSIGVIYLPPDKRGDLRCIEKHIDSIGAIISQLEAQDVAFAFGDYNQSGLVWNIPSNAPPSVDCSRSRFSTASSALLDGFCFHGLTQINPVPNRNGRLLDLVLANDVALSRCSITEAADPVTPLDTDHPALEVDVNLPTPTGFEDVPDLTSFNFQKADFAALHQAIAQVDWEFLETIEDVDAAVARFSDVMTRIIVDCVPVRRTARRPIWGNRRLGELKRLRSSALRRFCRLRCPFAKQELNRTSNEYRLYNRFLHKQYTRRMQKNLRRNPKLFWSFVNSKRMEKGLPVNMFLVNHSVNTALEKCNLFATHFKRAFNYRSSSEMQVAAAVRDTQTNVLNLDIFRVTSDVVEAAIRKLKYSLTPGPDGIPSCVLKKCAPSLAYPLSVYGSIRHLSTAEYVSFAMEAVSDVSSTQERRQT